MAFSFDTFLPLSMLVVVSFLFMTCIVMLVFTVRMDFMGMLMPYCTVYMRMDMLMVMLMTMLRFAMLVRMFMLMLVWMFVVVTVFTFHSSLLFI